MGKKYLTLFLSAAIVLSSAACFMPDARAGGEGRDAVKGSTKSIVKEPSGLTGLLEKARLEKTNSNYAEAARLYTLALDAALASPHPYKRQSAGRPLRANAERRPGRKVRAPWTNGAG